MRSADPEQTKRAPLPHVHVWDIWTRVFHWAVVCLVGVSWISADLGLMNLHLGSGAALLTLLLFRVAWGFVGSTTARFSSFVTTPRKVFDYFGALAKGEQTPHAGHNPAGGWMVLSLVIILIAQVSTGLFANDGVRFNGPLATRVSQDTSDWLTEIHGGAFNLILLLVWMHIVAVGFHLCVKGENLIGPMLSGRKHLGQVPAPLNLEFASIYRALFLLALSAALVVWLVWQ